VRVIILTVYDDEVFRNEAKAYGAAAYVVKQDAESVEMLLTLIQNMVATIARRRDPEVLGQP
jgi:DNA-binding NarL/FixJ family response regulator